MSSNFAFFPWHKVYVAANSLECHEIFDTSANEKIITSPVKMWNQIGQFVIGRADNVTPGLAVTDMRTGITKEILLDESLFSYYFSFRLFGNLIVCTDDGCAVIDVTKEQGKEIICCFSEPPELELHKWVLATDEFLFGISNQDKYNFIAWNYKQKKLAITIPNPSEEIRYPSFHYWNQHLITHNGETIFFCSLITGAVKSVVPFAAGTSQYIEYLEVFPEQSKLVGMTLLGAVVIMNLQDPQDFTILSFNNNGSGLDEVAGVPMLIDMGKNEVKWYNLQGEERYKLHLPNLSFYPRTLFGTTVAAVRDNQVLFYDLSNEEKLGQVNLKGKYVLDFGFFVEQKKSLLQYQPGQKQIPYDIQLLLWR